MYSVSNRPEQPSFQDIQRGFAARIRDPEHAAMPVDVDTRRMAVYEELFYNNIESLLSTAFPVIRQLHGDEAWHALVRRFIAQHRAHTPYFAELPREFLAFLKAHPEAAARFPFIQELAHYEWLELALSIAQMPSVPGFHRDGDLLQGIPLLSPLAWLHRYHYPVHRIGPDFIPQQAEEAATHLLVYRNREDEVGFIELNPVSAELIQRLQTQPTCSGESHLRAIATQLNHPNPATVIAGGLQILEDLRQRAVVLGTLVQQEQQP